MSTAMAGERAGFRPVLGFVGAGRAGSALALGLRGAGYDIAAVASHSGADATALADAVGARSVVTALDVARSSDLTLLTVPDPALPAVAATIAASGMPLTGRALVHSSARESSTVLAAARISGAQVGVLHPLQALAGAASAQLLSGSTFRIEGEGALRGWLKGMVADLGGSVIEVPEAALNLYHAAAVLAGNAPLALLARATALLTQAGVPEEQAHRGLAALLEGAAHNARERSAAEALTGPIVRGDAEAVSGHLAALESDPATRDLYRMLAREMLALLEPGDSSRAIGMLALLQDPPPAGGIGRPARVA